ncbi:MAG TPA: FAD-binding oxidoreductase [Cryomorphaceae bacterium]|nr:FAD-binding oxidoreductase [Owenweeksia sp.]HBF22050.1 FAD-binding oxidoreductase [Cryomorphaceae bacterium]HCQ14700.1 FAD-binding oxidoreductase [Cryomorphaceae bacterium]|tara:strand:+ start:14867 stop:16276 length:1410 start_codon:yes stop_codon:yes gene_type:complete
MNYNRLSKEHKSFLKEIVGEKGFTDTPEELEKYSHDETEDFSFLPEAVVKPSNTGEVSQILKYCNDHKIAVTASGARTGLSGGALPVAGGINLSMERMNRIIDIDARNLQATVEPGVINQVFHMACKEKGLFYPPDPSSWGSSFLGGNLALNAGGPKAVKYGVTNAYVLNLEVVLASGEVIWTGANVLKNSTGYNLTQLMVGSEGTLGIITKAVFRLIPYPKHNLLMLIPFGAPEKACEAVSAIFQSGITPSGMEFMERDAIDWTLRFVEDVQLPIGDDVKAHLLIEVDGNDEDILMRECEEIATIAEAYGAGEVLFADNQNDKDALWKLRRRVGEAVKSHSIYKEEDTVVPRAELAKLLLGVKEIGAKYGFKSVCYGHAGDGNLHVNIVKADMSDDAWQNELPKGIREIFKLVKGLGGTISGEHGIGWVQKDYMDIVFSPAELALQRAIKNAFDPNGILNPGKIFVDH